MSLLKLPNIPQFLLFRVFFNARFYYPIFALLFLDFGLSLSEFSASNLIWAVTIVCLEVPSGALADILGRKQLVVIATVLMILEMAVLLVAEPNSGQILLFWFCLNRFLSGAGEAMASGADEALAYDSIKEAGAEDRWTEVLELQTKLSSLAFFIAMLLGAAVYDPGLMTKVSQFLGWEQGFTKEDTLKLPIWLTLANGLVALAAALLMKNPAIEETGETDSKNPFQKVKEVAKSLAGRNQVLAVIWATVLFDQAARSALTMSSKTFSAYGIGEAWFGVIGAGFALIGITVAKPARWLVDNKSKSYVFTVFVTLSFIGMLGQAWGRGAFALVFIAVLSAQMSLIGFAASFYLNQLSDSQERATLLSFKGLACNLGFGLVSLYYSAVTAVVMTDTADGYLNSLYSLPAYFTVCLLVYLIWSKRRA